MEKAFGDVWWYTFGGATDHDDMVTIHLLLKASRSTCILSLLVYIH